MKTSSYTERSLIYLETELVTGIYLDLVTGIYLDLVTGIYLDLVTGI